MKSRDPIDVGMYAFNCKDAAALARFWSAVLMRPVDEGANPAFATIGFDGPGPTWMFHQPEGELASGDNRLMLDLSGDTDWAQQADRIEALGAERVSDNEQDDGTRWVVFRDPENNRFRIFGPRPV
ncbi:Glyoxalase-like domain-containing protein [Promicromonospora umidemergens]|uniref:VOC family protein n=1 Tax=Promicromonospora umidemergens TaxID=629679 RepID=A0ABP8YFY1_9MICO|nr:VOC family protein [Promicromonospora umidemergens]MCP2282247.1 Glyoxalase-like domain-containing protein [Promicromonospora umidemergens]